MRRVFAEGESYDATVRRARTERKWRHARARVPRGGHAPADGHARRGPPRRGMEHGHRHRMRLFRLSRRRGPILGEARRGKQDGLRTRESGSAALPSYFDLLNDDLVRMVVWATTEGGAVRPPAALRGVDQRLRTIVKGTRIWRDEWVDAWMERCTLEGLNWNRSSIRGGRRHVHREMHRELRA